jgi:ketosteroid isomerase-like protein
MSARKDVVEKYIDGFRRGDHEAILSCLTDDVLWEIHGHATVRGKADFDGAIENDATPGRPTLTIDRLIEEGDSVVAVGSGGVALAIGGRLEFVFSDVFTFNGDAISRVESYQVNLSGLT